MKVLFSGSVPKDITAPLDNEDYFKIDLQTNRIVVCDGASESFDSKTWGSILGDSFLLDPEINTEWVSAAILKFNETVNVESLSWSKQAAYSRGSFSTLLGVCERPGGGLDLVGVGDSLLVYLEDGEVRFTFPYTHSDSFQNHPTLFSTVPDQNQGLFENSSGVQISAFLPPSSRADRIIFLMTDALGDWFLRMLEGGTPAWKIFFDLQSEAELEEFTLSRRDDKSMRTDDSTLVVIRL